MWRPQLIVLQPTPYCNINCDYCYLQNRNDRALMPDAVVEAVRDKIFARLAHDAAPTVVWHAGEPTVAPISWYRRAYSALLPATPPDTTYTMQSNGVSLPDAWIDFLCETNTRIGLSIDGPEHFHDAHRRTRRGGPTWALVMRNLRRLQAANLHPTIITVLQPSALTAAEEFYRFYRDHDIHQVSVVTVAMHVPYQQLVCVHRDGHCHQQERVPCGECSPCNLQHIDQIAFVVRVLSIPLM